MIKVAKGRNNVARALECCGNREDNGRINSRNTIYKLERGKDILVIQVFTEASNKTKRRRKTEREEAEIRLHRQS